MKRSVLLAVFCFYSFSAWADRCVLNTQSITLSALQQLQTVKTVVHYCPSCIGDNHIRYINISDLNILPEKTGQIIQVGNAYLDLAYIYLPTGNPNIYHNLGYIVSCANLRTSAVLEYLDTTHPYGIENIEKLSKQLDLCQTTDCIKTVYRDILKNYFDSASNTLKGFPFEQITLPLTISKIEVQKLLENISHYYGEN